MKPARKVVIANGTKQPKLLIINCPSEHFLYIPMGTFGLCDYLRRKGIETRILNLSLYAHAEIHDTFDYYLNEFQPTHAGLIFHWQETAEGFFWAGEHVRSRRPDIKIIAGGFTAGYFGENLLEKCRFLDSVIQGDPERPMELLLNGAGADEIPNLIHRKAGICSNRAKYHTDRRTLSWMSFSDLSFLYDHERYVEAIEKKLGFPVFIGRGCRHSCDYCGGSRRAFTLHSRGSKAAARSIPSVIADLRRLRDFVRTIYICYENDLTYLKDLFRAIQKEPELAKTFRLNYGAWNLPDEEFLGLYREVFAVSQEWKPVLELSPEVYDDRSREKIKQKQGEYAIEALRENIEFINTYFKDTVTISVFFSRYHSTLTTYRDMRKEIHHIFRFKHELVCRDLWNVNVSYGHLSTDVGSCYWEKYIDNPGDFETLVSGIRGLRVQEQFSFPFDNLCLYVPQRLTKEEVFKTELLIFILRVLERSFFEMFHILFSCLDELLIELIEDIIESVYKKRTGNVFRNLDHAELLDLFKSRITEKIPLSRRIPFAEDLIALHIKKVQCIRTSPHMRSGYQTERPKLNDAFISVCTQDYLNLPDFLRKLKNGPDTLAAEITVSLFLADEIITMTYDTYRATIKEFEEGISVEEYYQLMERKKIFTHSYHKNLIAKLFQSNVLY
ncbi:MAG: hypothetical protein RDU01_11545 [Thermodesulfovibrionales bacterium]|nr:hypothetical protein [Thermodesulfovibrionales bacterium]